MFSKDNNRCSSEEALFERIINISLGLDGQGMELTGLMEEEEEEAGMTEEQVMMQQINAARLSNIEKGHKEILLKLQQVITDNLETDHRVAVELGAFYLNALALLVSVEKGAS